MTKNQADKKPTELDTREQDKRAANLVETLVRDSVLGGLGKPTNNYRVQVKCVWGNKFRVNVFVGPDISSFKVAHSYFVEADGNGLILSSTPALKKLY